MITFRHKGDFSKTTKFLNQTREPVSRSILEHYGKLGVDALASATPVDSGLTASSWYYTIEQNDKGFSIRFNNSNIQNGFKVAIMLQYGHGTNGGGYVQGIDYINPAVRPVFNELANKAWKEVAG